MAYHRKICPLSEDSFTITENPMHEFELLNTIKVERAKRDMTQAELTIKVGVSRKTINTIERRKILETS